MVGGVWLQIQRTHHASNWCMTHTRFFLCAFVSCTCTSSCICTHVHGITFTISQHITRHNMSHHTIIHHPPTYTIHSTSHNTRENCTIARERERERERAERESRERDSFLRAPHTRLAKQRNAEFFGLCARLESAAKCSWQRARGSHVYITY